MRGRTAKLVYGRRLLIIESLHLRLQVMFVGALVALLAVTASAQPFLPGTGFLPLGALLATMSLYRNRNEYLSYVNSVASYVIS